jgi:hypothetical protein
LPKAEAHEARARAAGRTTVANAIANHIEQMKDREARLNTRLSNIEAKCGTSGSTGSSASESTGSVS